LNEVKSSTRIKHEHLEQVALQTYVAVQNGLELTDAHLVYINDKYVLDEKVDWNALFCREMHGVLSLREAPDVRPSRHCFKPHDCEFWQRCISEKPKDWVFHIPHISSADFDELESFDVDSMRDVPNRFPLNPKQRRVVDVAKSGEVYRSPELTRILLPWHLPSVI